MLKKTEFFLAATENTSSNLQEFKDDLFSWSEQIGSDNGGELHVVFTP